MRVSFALALVLAATLCGNSAFCKEEPVYKPCSDCQRKSVPDKYKWRLEHLVPSKAEWEKEFSALEKEIPALGALKGTLAKGDKEVKTCLEKSTALGKRVDRLAQYAFQLWSVDSDNAEAANLFERSEYLSGKLNSERSFIEPELIALDEKTLEHLKGLPELADYDHAVDDLLRRKAHVLGPEAENVLSLMENLSATPYTVMNSMHDEMPLPMVKDETGADVKLTFSNFPSLRSSTNRDVRKTAVDTFFKALDGFKKSYASTLASKLKADSYIAKARGYQSALEASLDSDAVTVEFFKTLIDTTATNLPRTIHKYVELRKQILGLDSVHYYDLYTPLFEGAEQFYSYEAAVPLIQEAMKPMGPEYNALLAKGMSLDSGWADIFPNKGKKSGAYCTGVYGFHPYVQLNHMGKLEDVFTVAHEYGHAMHFHYSMASQPYPKSDSPIFLAEIPSTFQEAMLLDYLLNKTTDKKEKMALLVKRLETIRTTIVRQIMFAEFEMLAHEEIEKGGAATPERLSEIYLGLIKKYYGPSFSIDGYDAMEWAYIPHFYYNFYVYKYGTGLMAAFVFSKRILEGDDNARVAFIDMLKAGGSDYPMEILNKAGLNIADPEVITETFDLFEKTMKQLTALLD